jgi:hypothetical protein
MEIVVYEKCVNLLIIVMFVYDDYGFASVRLGDDCFFFREFVVNISQYMLLSLVCIMGIMVRVVYLFEFFGGHYTECVLFLCFQQTGGFLCF